MIVLADNDIILKLAQCDLLENLPDIFGTACEQIFITEAARFQLLPKKIAKALSKCGNEETLARLTAFLASTQSLPEVMDTALLARMGDFDGIDGGEKFLFASAVEKPGALLMTGDRRALRTLLEHQRDLPTVFSALENAVVTFESFILLALQKLGFAIVKQKLLGSPKPDGLLRLILKSETGEEEFVECLCSYSKEVIPLLAFKNLMSPSLH